MRIEEREGWLFVRLTHEEQDADLDWGRFVRWKIPEEDRVYVPDGDLWAVRATHRELVEHLYRVYRAVVTAGLDLKALQTAQALIADVEARYPNADASQEARFRAWLRDVGLN